MMIIIKSVMIDSKNQKCLARCYWDFNVVRAATEMKFYI